MFDAYERTVEFAPIEAVAAAIRDGIGVGVPIEVQPGFQARPRPVRSTAPSASWSAPASSGRSPLMART
jgi:hypothetical protein